MSNESKDTFEAAGAAATAHMSAGGVPAPLSVGGFLAAHRAVRVPGNGEYFSFTDATARSSGARALPDEAAAAAHLVSPLFEDNAPVYRSIVAAPQAAVTAAPAAQAGKTAPSSSLSPEFLLATPIKVVAAAPTTPVLAAAAHIRVPAVPRPYVMSHQAWAVPATSASPADIASELHAAFAALDMDAELVVSAAEFRVAAVVDFNTVRFNVKMFAAGATTLVEFNLQNGPSMQYLVAYGSVVDRLSAKVASLCPGARKALRVPTLTTKCTAAPRRCTMSPPSLTGASASSVRKISAGDCLPLVRMAAQGSLPLQRDATAALVELSTEAANAEVLVQDGVLAQMATLVSTCNDWCVVHSAVSAIANILAVVFKNSDSDATTASVDASMGVITGLLSEVRQRSRSAIAADAASQQSLRRQCCRALASMALNARLAAAMQHAGGVDVLHAAKNAMDKREAGYASTAVQRLQAVVA